MNDVAEIGFVVLQVVYAMQNYLFIYSTYYLTIYYVSGTELSYYILCRSFYITYFHTN